MRGVGNETIFLFPKCKNSEGYTWSSWLESNDFCVSFLEDNASEDRVIGFLSNLIQQHNIQIIHSHFGMYHKLLIKYASKLGVKVVFHDHMDFSLDGNIHKQKLRSMIWATLYRLKGIHIISVMKQKYNAYCLAGKQQNHYIPNALSLRRNITAVLSREELRKQWGISEDTKLCFLLGWDMYGKGMDVAIKAVAKYRETDPSVHLGIIGVGTPPGAKNQGWIAENTGVDPNSEWLHYFPSLEDMFACDRAIDVYLSASRKEAFSYGLLEAISQNTPVVVSDVAGTKWSWDYDKCFTYPVEDVVACAHAIGQAVQVGRKPSNYKEITEKYHIQKWCTDVMSIYHKMDKGC